MFVTFQESVGSITLDLNLIGTDRQNQRDIFNISFQPL